MKVRCSSGTAVITAPAASTSITSRLRRKRHPRAGSFCDLNPISKRVSCICNRLIDRCAHCNATVKFRENDAICSRPAVNQSHIPSHAISLRDEKHCCQLVGQFEWKIWFHSPRLRGEGGPRSGGGKTRARSPPLRGPPSPPAAGRKSLIAVRRITPNNGGAKNEAQK
jgi:hypothetical protein